jgi:hypothetical protein
MKSLSLLSLVFLNVAGAAPLTASARGPLAASPGVSDVLLNVRAAAPLAAAPAAAWPWDSEQPGSFLVFPKFNTGTVTTGDQGKLPRSEFEISVVCPTAILPVNGGPGCATSGQAVYLHAAWVCGHEGSYPFSVCEEKDWRFSTTVNASLYFSPNSATDMVNLGVLATPVPESALPLCSSGYLIVWVEDANGNPIKFDGLIGDAILRTQTVSAVPATAAAGQYNAIAIQGSDNVNTNDLLAVDPNTGAVAFDDNGSGYKSVTGKIFGTVRYPGPTFATATATAPTGRIKTDLVLLTLDANVGNMNPVTSVDLNFTNEKERMASASLSFKCWTEEYLDDFPINMDNTFGRKGLIYSEPAQQTDAISGTVTRATLLGLIETQEFLNVDGTIRVNQYFSLLSHDDNGVPTTLVP